MLNMPNNEIPTTQWCIVSGSSWEALKSSKSINSNTSMASSSDAQESDNEQLMGSALRQVKYELYCATVDLLGFRLDISSNRNCKAQSAYFLEGSSQDKGSFEFVYDYDLRKYTDVIWTNGMQEYADLYHYWVMEKQCIPGFLAEVFLDMYHRRDSPPPDRPRGRGLA